MYTEPERVLGQHSHLKAKGLGEGGGGGGRGKHLYNAPSVTIRIESPREGRAGMGLRELGILTSCRPHRDTSGSGGGVGGGAGGGGAVEERGKGETGGRGRESERGNMLILIRQHMTRVSRPN